jgi:hypothetical protein
LLAASSTCSREEPQPKFFPATITLPGGTRFDVNQWRPM